MSGRPTSKPLVTAHDRLEVCAGLAVPLFMLGLCVESQMAGEGCGSSAEARAGQITTMVTRFNQFRPGGAEPILLVDGRIYSESDLSPLVTAGYCGEADLVNHVDATRGWVWKAGRRKFIREEPEPAWKKAWSWLAIGREGQLQ